MTSKTRTQNEAVLRRIAERKAEKLGSKAGPVLRIDCPSCGHADAAKMIDIGYARCQCWKKKHGRCGCDWEGRTS